MSNKSPKQPNWPSKKTGKPSGPRRDNATPKRSKTTAPKKNS